MSGISILDSLIVGAYLLIIVAIGIWVGRTKKNNISDYFLAGRSLKWPIVGSALFATNISTIHLVGLAAGGYDLGLVIGNFEWMAAFTLILLALVFAPKYFQSKVSTIPEFIEKRFSSGTRTAVAIVSIASALFIHIGLSLYAGAAVIEAFFGIPSLVSIVAISLLTTIYTVVGGLKAVVVTETLQTVLLLFGAVLVTWLGYEALQEIGIKSYKAFSEQVKPEQMSMLYPIKNESGQLNEFSWLAILLGYPILGIWYWCTDQTIVQRVLGAKSQHDAQIGALFAGFLKILPVFLMVVPGIMAYVLFKDKIGQDSNQALPVMISELVPTGLKGLIVAGMLAALMSTISGALHSCATLVSVDIVKRLKPETSDKSMILYGRIAACVVMILAVLWSTQGGKFTSIFEAINKIPVAFAPPIATIFLWGVLWKRGTWQAAMTTIIFGLGLGLVILAIDLPLIGSTRIVTDVLGIPFMLQAALLFALYSVLFCVISLLTPPPNYVVIRDTSWESPGEVFKSQGRSTITDPRILGVLLFIVVILLYVAFA